MRVRMCESMDGYHAQTCEYDEKSTTIGRFPILSLKKCAHFRFRMSFFEKIPPISSEEESISPLSAKWKRCALILRRYIRIDTRMCVDRCIAVCSV